MLNHLKKIMLFLFLIFSTGLLMHLIFLDATILLNMIYESFGKVLAFCGINGIVVSEKTKYLEFIFFLYIFFMIIFGILLTVIIKNLIERIVFQDTVKETDQALNFLQFKSYSKK